MLSALLTIALLLIVVPFNRVLGELDYSQSDLELLDNIINKRPAKCVGTSGKCYSNAQCCNELSCSAPFDDSTGKRPKAPGYCVKRNKKSARPCDTSLDCPDGTMCSHLGRSRQRICQQARLVQQQQPWQSEPLAYSQGGASGPAEINGKSLGGLGAQCMDSSDCQLSYEDSSTLQQTALCCQKVYMGRQKSRQLCDRVKPISVCIPPPNL